MPVTFSRIYKVAPETGGLLRPGAGLTDITPPGGPFAVTDHTPAGDDGARFTLREFVRVSDAAGRPVCLNGAADPQFSGYVPDPEAIILQSGGAAFLLSDAEGLTALPEFVEENAVCFGEGTMIATPGGEIAVEALRPGDEITTLRGPARVVWVGHQTLMPAFHPPERVALICLRAGCLSEGVPHTDLMVTADHAILVDGVLCHAGALVNGTSILRLPQPEPEARITVYHIETHPQHILFANGAPAESFPDTVSRRAFHNYRQTARIGNRDAEIVPLAYPRALGPRHLPPQLRRRLMGPRTA